MNGKVISVTTYVLKAGTEDLLLPELESLIEVIRQIEGCLAFDLYRLSERRQTLVLHETWETEEAYRGYALSPLPRQLASLFVHYVAQPPQTWQVEEICCWRARSE